MSKRLILLLVLCVHLATSAAILAKRDTPEQKEEGVKILNKIRAEIAKENQIGNMREMTYDYELEKVANSMIGNCNFLNGDYMLVPALELKRVLKQVSNPDSNEKVNEAVAIAVFHPFQTKVGCVDLTTPCANRGIEKGFCLFGPYSQPPNERVEKGSPGSHCERGATANGLCKTDSKTVESYEKLTAEEGSGAETPKVDYEKTTPGNVEEKGAETKAATHFNSMILAVVFAIVMIFQ